MMKYILIFVLASLMLVGCSPEKEKPRQVGSVSQSTGSSNQESQLIAQQVASSPTASLTSTRQPMVTRTPMPTKTPAPSEYTATGDANVRACPALDCDIVDRLVLGQRLTMVDMVQGDEYRGSSTWYELRLSDGSTGFVHSAFAREGTPRPAPRPVQPRATLAPTTQTQNIVPPANEPPPVQPTAQSFEPATSVPPQSAQWSCAGDLYNCGDFNRNTLHSYWAACPGDPSRLDADNDGIPCESIW